MAISSVIASVLSLSLSLSNPHPTPPPPPRRARECHAEAADRVAVDGARG